MVELRLHESILNPTYMQFAVLVVFTAKVTQGFYATMQNLYEDFVLLKMLSAEPAQSSSNTLDGHRSAHNDTLMSLEHERKIVNCLAFLFAITDDPLKVGALCLERYEDLRACTIRVAMNTGVSEEFMTGFRSLARALEDECNAGKSAYSLGYGKTHVHNFAQWSRHPALAGCYRWPPAWIGVAFCRGSDLYMHESHERQGLDYFDD